MKSEFIEITKFHKNFLWLATFFSICSLLPIIDPLMQVFLPVVFILIGLSNTDKWITPLLRLLVFITLISIVLINAGGLDKEVGTSMLICTLIMKFLELRKSRDVFMMILFNSVAPFVAFLQEQTPLILVCGVLSFILNLSASKSLTENHHGKSSRMLSTVSGILSQSALLLPFVVIFYLLSPRMDSPLWQSYGQFNAKTGISDNMNVSHWSRLFEDYSTAFRVTFKNKTPPAKDMYFRGLTLWTFNGESWDSEPIIKDAVKARVAPRGQINSESTYNYSISYQIRSRYVFVMDYPVSIPKSMVLYSDDKIGSSYGSSGKINWISAPGKFEPLTKSERASALQLPSSGNEKTINWAKRMRKNHDSDADFANFVINYIRSNNYQYSLEPPPVGKNAIDDFFFENKSGFCAHYSSAYAFIMRAAGIPARIVNGYFGSELSELGNYYRIRQADAHAWVEIWLDNSWVRVDPTIASTSQQTRTHGSSWNFINKTYETIDFINQAWDKWFLYYDEARQEQVVEKIKSSLDFKNYKIKNVNNILFAIFTTLFTILLLVLLIKKKKTKKQKIISDLNKWFERYGKSSCPEGHTWNEKAIQIKQLLTDNDYDKLINIINNANSCIFNDTDINWNKISKELFKIKPNKDKL